MPSIRNSTLTTKFVFSFAIILASSFQTNAQGSLTVFDVQVQLNEHGYDLGDPDGLAGPATRKSLEAFSKKHGLVDASIMSVYRYMLEQNLEQRDEINSGTSLESNIKEKVSSRLRDPSSAQFRDLYLVPAPGSDSKFFNICGEVNGKNAYGGYAGYTYFYILGVQIGEGDIITAGDAILDNSRSNFAEKTCILSFRSN